MDCDEDALYDIIQDGVTAEQVNERDRSGRVSVFVVHQKLAHKQNLLFICSHSLKTVNWANRQPLEITIYHTRSFFTAGAFAVQVYPGMNSLSY